MRVSKLINFLFQEMKWNEIPPGTDYLFFNEKPPSEINEFLRFSHGIKMIFRFASYLSS